ncbi:MAG: thiamine-phosphate kinase [Candidatus Thiodiazotropha sp.]
MHHTSASSEFDLIRHYFDGITPSRSDVSLAIGDDAALVCVPPGQQLAISVDTLVCGVHFFPSVAPQSLGHKALAVNLSDLAAMGAEPAWATLALTLPDPDESWLKGFAEGFATLAKRHGVQLIGGDTTRGPLSVTLQVQGLLPEGSALKRSGARVGDGVYVTGELGDAALCLHMLREEKGLAAPFAGLRRRLEWPQPRIDAGMSLRGLASSAIDISDGLLADLGHILQASGVGATIELQRLPLSELYARWFAESGDWTPTVAGGDDYELCFTAAAEREGELHRLGVELGLRVSRIGTIEAAPGMRVWMPDGKPWPVLRTGFDHFAGEE